MKIFREICDPSIGDLITKLAEQLALLFDTEENKKVYKYFVKNFCRFVKITFDVTNKIFTKNLFIVKLLLMYCLAYDMKLLSKIFNTNQSHNYDL